MFCLCKQGGGISSTFFVPTSAREGYVVEAVLEELRSMSPGNKYRCFGPFLELVTYVLFSWQYLTAPYQDPLGW